jgi:hypothetical protein
VRVVGVKHYCGKDTLIEDQGIRQGHHVVLDLVAKAGMIEGSHVYFDNLFTSLSFAVAAVRGTVCQDRLNKVPIKGKKEFQKKAVPRARLISCTRLTKSWWCGRTTRLFTWPKTLIHGADMKTCLQIQQH